MLSKARLNLYKTNQVRILKSKANHRVYKILQETNPLEMKVESKLHHSKIKEKILERIRLKKILQKALKIVYSNCKLLHQGLKSPMD